MKKTLSLLIVLILLIGCKEDKYPTNFKENLPFGLKYHITKKQTYSILNSLNKGKIVDGDSTNLYFDYQFKKGHKNNIRVENYFENDSLYSIRINNANEDYDNKTSIKVKNEMAIEFFKDQKINLNAYSKSEDSDDYYVFQMKNSLEKIILSLSGSLDNYVIMFKDGIITKRIDTNYKQISDKKQKEQLEKERQKLDGTKTIIVENSVLDGSVRQVEKYLKASLKDAKSYKGIEWSKVIETERGYSVRHKYRAKNSLGGFVIENKLFYLDFKGNVLREE